MNKDKANDVGKGTGATKHAIGGAVVGAATSQVVGRMGLAAMGTAVGVGALPMAIAGAVLGLAIFGLKEALSEDEGNDQDSK